MPARSCIRILFGARSFRARMPHMAASPWKDLKCSKGSKASETPQAPRVAAHSGESQDMIELGERVSKTLRESPGIHGFLLKGHGLYTWGAGFAGSQAPC